MAETTRQQWQSQPSNVRSAAAGLVAGAIFGLLTKNVGAAIGIAVLLAVIAFIWPGIHSPARGLLGLVAIVGCLAIAFGTAYINTVNGYPTGGGSYTSTPYTCGSVVQDPIKNPTSVWVQVENVQTSDGFDHPGSKAMIDDCTTRLRSFRIDTAVLLGIGLLALIGAIASESRWRKRYTAED